MRAVCFLLAAFVMLGSLMVLGIADLSRADEVRMKDGEVLHGETKWRGETQLRVTPAHGPARRVAAKDVDEVIPGPTPLTEFFTRSRTLAAEDVDGRVELARFAWRHRLDPEARQLSEEALSLDPQHLGAHRMLGHVRTVDGWIEGWPAPWAPAGRTGPRWGRARRAAGTGRRKVVDAALAWLAAHQDEDGTIDADGFAKHCPDGDACPDPGGGHHGERQPCAFDGVTTALAVMAWLAHGSTPVSGPYADHVARGLERCVAVTERGLGGFDAIWNHAFATQAVADACAAVRDPDLRDVLHRAVSTLLARQLDDGGWSYVYAIGDVPTTAVVLSALGLAAQAGVGVDVGAVERGLAFLERRVEAKSSKSEYHDGAERKGYTPTAANAAATLAARAALGTLGETPDLTRRLGLLTAKRPRWKLEFKEVETRDGRKVKAQIGNLYPYQWYYSAFALAARGKSGGAWMKALGTALAGGQEKAGHAAGSWEPLGPYSRAGGRVFVTALCTLMLQAPYRYPRER